MQQAEDLQFIFTEKDFYPDVQTNGADADQSR